MNEPTLTDTEPCCEHSLSWHHETRGCGYHGFSGLDRCPCLLPFDEALAHHDAAIVAEAVDRERAAWAGKVEALAVAAAWGRYEPAEISDAIRGLLAADDTEGKP